MARLKKEEVYINLQGKSKEELTELYDFLESIGEKQYDSKQEFLKDYTNWGCYVIEDNEWTLFKENWCFTEVTTEQLKEILQPVENTDFDLKGYSVKVDNEEQAKQLQEMAFKQGFEWYQGKRLKYLDEKFFSFNAFNKNKIHWGTSHFQDEFVTKLINFKDIFISPMGTKEEQLKKEAIKRGYTYDNFICLLKSNNIGVMNASEWSYCSFSDRLFTNSYGNGGQVLYEGGKWAEFKDNTLEQQLVKAEAEVKRLKREIKENKFRIGDWVYRKDATFWRIRDNYDLNPNLLKNCKKVTDEEFLKMLNKYGNN